MRFFPVFTLVLALSQLHAGEEDVGTTSASFLKLGAGARPASLGEAYVGLADDASGIAYNPAGMSQMLAGDLELTHTEWFQGLLYEDINAVFPMGDGGMVGTTINFLSVPTITRTEQIANTSDPSQNFISVGTFTPFDLAASLAYSRPIYSGLLAGFNFKVINQSIDGSSTLGLALDLGAFYMTPVKDLNLGFAIQNLGTPITLKSEAFDLPVNIRLGGSYRIWDNAMLLLVEGDLPSDVAPVLALGAEYNVNDRLYLRGGYRLNSLFDPWTAGLGFKFDPAALDLSVVPFGELGLTYRATLSYSFGQPDAQLTTAFAYLSTNSLGKGIVINTQVSAPGRVAAWAFYIYDSGHPPSVVKEVQAVGPVPNQISWDGKLTDGKPAPEGKYWAIMSVRYSTGKSINTKYLSLEVDNTPPQVDLALDPVSVNPQAAGEAFVPTQFKVSFKGRAIAHWRLEILDPQGKVFRTYQGDDTLPEDGLRWDGKGDQGEDLISGQVYQARMSVTDPLGNQASSTSVVSFRAVFR